MQLTSVTITQVENGFVVRCEYRQGQKIIQKQCVFNTKNALLEYLSNSFGF